MEMSSDTEIKIRGQLFAMHQVIAFLLAREAVRAGVAFNDLHGALVSDTMAACSKVNEGGVMAGQFEAAVSVELDSLFGMAEIFRRVMPDK